MSEQNSESNSGICDACTDFHNLLKNREFTKRNFNFAAYINLWFFLVENHLQPVTEGYDGHELLVIDKDQLNVFYHYLGVWVQR